MEAGYVSPVPGSDSNSQLLRYREQDKQIGDRAHASAVTYLLRQIIRAEVDGSAALLALAAKSVEGEGTDAEAAGGMCPDVSCSIDSDCWLFFFLAML